MEQGHQGMEGGAAVSDLVQLYANANIRIAELERENIALRADKERLDWLETQDCWIGVYGEYDINARICAGGSHSQRIRSAVDAARKEAQP
jgi:hypothetical protein